MLKSSLLSFFFLGLLTFSAPAKAIDGFYVGAQVGNVGLFGDFSSLYSNAIGFGLDLGVRTNPLLDVVAQFQRSAHSGPVGASGLTLYSTTLSANFHYLEFNDFDFSLGGGPGFYFFKTDPRTDSLFGLHGGTSVDVNVGDHVKIGLGFQIHGVFNTNSGTSGSYWTAMMRLGYFFGS